MSIARLISARWRNFVGRRLRGLASLEKQEGWIFIDFFRKRSYDPPIAPVELGHQSVSEWPRPRASKGRLDGGSSRLPTRPFAIGRYQMFPARLEARRRGIS